VGKVFDGKATSSVIDGKMSGEIFNMPHGPAALAVGFQLGQEEFDQTPAPVLASGDLSGFGGNVLPVSRDRDTRAFFAELNLPLLRTLEANIAVRHDDYSDFGSTTNPKVSVRWNPARQILLRGSWGTGFVAPTLTQAYGANTVGLTQPGLADPLRCPTTQDTNDCVTQFGVLFGGNPNLKPQKSDQWTVGFVFEPVTGISLSFDWFNLTVEELFSNGPTPLTILSDLPQFGNLVTRGPVQPQFPGIPGPITQIDQRFINIGEVRIEGFDINVKAISPPTEWGRFTFNLDGTYYRKYDVQQTDGTFASFVSNQLGSATSGLNPRYKQYATLTWSRGTWSATLGNQYQSSYVDVGTLFDDDATPRRVGTLSLWDLYASYTGFKNWKFVLGVQNLFDKDPPFTNQQTTFQVGYDPTYYDARARFVYGSVTYSFQ
jgi:iron complex outermembrane receptor protein